MNSNRNSLRRTPEAQAGLRFILLVLAITGWGVVLSNQITEIGRALTHALNVRQVVVVPPHATMVDEAPTPVSGP